MALQGFVESEYLAAKLAALQADPAYKAQWTGKTPAQLKVFLANAGFTPEQHYQQYGWTEGLAPNALFNQDEYKLAKAKDMFNDGLEPGGTPYGSEAEALAAFEAAWPYDPYLHYVQYGFGEGIDPSNNFDQSQYLADKLAALQTDPETADDWADKTPEDLLDALVGLGLSPLAHYVEYGKDEGIPVTEVPLEEQVNAGDIGVPGKMFTLTAGTDIFTPTADGDSQTTPNDDSFFAVLGEEEATSSRVTTFNNGDLLDGGAGNDTLILTAEDDYYEDNIVEMSNIENVVIRNYADTDLDLDASFWTGVDHYNIANGNDSVYVEYIADEFSKITLQNFGRGVTDDDGIYLTVNDDVFTGNADEMNIVLDNFGAGAVQVPARTLDDDVLDGNDKSIDGEYGYLDIDNDSGDDVIEVFNIESTGNSARGNFLKFDTAHEAATTLNIYGDTKLSINFSDGGDNDVLALVDASGLNADLFLRGMDSKVDLTIIGAQGDNDIAGGSYWDGESYTSKTITTFGGNDIIRAGDGDVVIDAGDGDNEIHARNAEDVVVTTGSGNDDIRARQSTVDISSGAGDDIVTVSGLNTGDFVDGGDGTDIIRFNMGDGEDYFNPADATSEENEDFADRFVNFEIVKLCEMNGATVDMAYLNNIQHVKLGYNTNDATILGLSDGATLDYEYDSTGDNVTVELTETDGDQTFNLNLFSAPEKVWNGVNGYDQVEGGGDDFGILTLNGVETLNIDTDSKCKDFDMWDGDLTDGIDPSFIMSTIALDVDALETLNITGLTDLDLSGIGLTTVETVDGSTYDNELILDMTGNANDVTVTLGDGDNDIIAGDGDDIITVGDGDNEITGGDGGDTITVGAGSNTFLYTAVTQSQGVDVDVITGFDTDDVLDFSAIGPGVYTGEAEGYGAVLTGLDTTGAESRAILDTDTGIVYWDVDASGTLDDADMAIKLSGVTDLSDTNFLFGEAPVPEVV